MISCQEAFIKKLFNHLNIWLNYILSKAKEPLSFLKKNKGNVNDVQVNPISLKYF